MHCIYDNAVLSNTFSACWKFEGNMFKYFIRFYAFQVFKVMEFISKTIMHLDSFKKLSFKNILFYKDSMTIMENFVLVLFKVATCALQLVKDPLPRSLCHV